MFLERNNNCGWQKKVFSSVAVGTSSLMILVTMRTVNGWGQKEVYKAVYRIV